MLEHRQRASELPGALYMHFMPITAIFVGWRIANGDVNYTRYTAREYCALEEIARIFPLPGSRTARSRSFRVVCRQACSSISRHTLLRVY